MSVSEPFDIMDSFSLNQLLASIDAMTVHSVPTPIRIDPSDPPTMRDISASRLRYPSHSIIRLATAYQSRTAYRDFEEDLPSLTVAVGSTDSLLGCHQSVLPNKVCTKPQ